MPTGKSNGRPIFIYVCYVGNKRLQDLVDSLRYLAEPGPRRPAHITIMGPYDQTLPERRVQSSREVLSREPIEVSSIGTFFEGTSQHTVYLECQSHVLREVWHKPGRGYHPHLTIYDGDSRDVALQVKTVLERSGIKFLIEQPKLQLLSLNNDIPGVRLNLDLLESEAVRALQPWVPDGPAESWPLDVRLGVMAYLLKAARAQGLID